MNIRANSCIYLKISYNPNYKLIFFHHYGTSYKLTFLNSEKQLEKIIELPHALCKLPCTINCSETLGNELTN